MQNEDLFASIEDGDLDGVIEAIQHGADPDARRAMLEQPAIVLAAENEHEDIVRALLQAGADPDACDFGKTTALIEAARSGLVGIVDALCAAGADVAIVDNKPGWTALHWAIWWSSDPSGDPRPGYPETIARLLDAGADPNQSGSDGLTPLMHAARLDRVDLVDMLLARGADPSGTTPDGKTAESIAEAKGARAALVRLVEHRGGDVASARLLSLPEAVEAGDIARVRDLLTGEGMVDRAMDDGSLVVKAIERDDADMVRVLLAAGVSIQTAPDWGSPVVCAAERGHAEILHTLFDAGADPNDDAAEALAAAACSGSGAAVQCLIDAGIDVAAVGALAVVAAADAGRSDALALILKAGADPNAKNEFREAAILVAARNGHEGAVGALIDGRARIDARSGNETALHAAASRGHASVVRRLLDAGAKPHGKGKLLSAVLHGDTNAVVASISAGEDVNAPEPLTRWTPLRWALMLGEDEIAIALIDAGAATVTDVDESILVDAAWFGRQQVVDRLVLDGVVRKDLRSAEIALSRAAESGHESIVAALVRAGVSPNARDDRRKTPLMRAADEGRIAPARTLLELGADPTQKDALGMTAADLADLHDHREMAELIREHLRRWKQRAADTHKTPGSDRRPKKRANQAELVRAVERGDPEQVRRALESGCDPNAEDDRGLRPILYALRSGNPDVLGVLLEAGADPDEPTSMPPLVAAIGNDALFDVVLSSGASVDARNRNGQTALMVACWREQVAHAMALLERGADVSLVDDSGSTALIYACMHGLGGVASRLLELGADPTVTDRNNRTALTYAAWSGLSDVARTLLDRAAAPRKPDPKLDLILAVAHADQTAIHAALARGAEPKTVDPFLKWPAILWAALLADDATVATLLAAGASPTVRKDGHTPVSIAWIRQRIDVVHRLVSSGADPNCRVQPSNQSILVSAAAAADAETVRTLVRANAKIDRYALLAAVAAASLECIRILVDAGARLDVVDLFDRTPLFRALAADRMEIAHYLIDRGASVNARVDGVPMLSWSLATAHRDAFDLLLPVADVGARDAHGDTPLHFAVRTGESDAVERLVARGADTRKKNKAGRTAPTEAAMLGCTRALAAMTAAAKPNRRDLVQWLNAAAEEGESGTIQELAAFGADGVAEAAARAASIPAEGIGFALSKATVKPMVDDEFSRSIQQTLGSRLPKETVDVFSGRAGSYWAVPSSHLDAVNNTGVAMSSVSWSAQAVDREMARIGFSLLGDLVASAMADVVVRLFVASDGLALGAFNVGMLGAQSIDFVTVFDDGVFLTTTTHPDVQAFPERGLCVRAYPGVWPSVLVGKHALRVARRRAVGATVSQAGSDLATVAAILDDFLVRRLAKN